MSSASPACISAEMKINSPTPIATRMKIAGSARLRRSPMNLRQPPCDHPQIEPELRHLGSDVQIVAGGAQQAQSARVGQRCPLQNRRADARDDEDGEKRQLKTGAKQGMRIGDQNSQRRRSNGVHHVAFAIQQTRAQICRQHQRGAPHRWTDPHHERVRERDHDRGDGRHRGIHAKLAQRPKNGERQDAQVHSGNHQHVIRARALVLGARRVAQERFFAENHGVHERGLRRGPQLVNLGHDAGVNARPPEFNPAAGKPGKPLNILCLRRPQHADAVVAQIAFIVEGSGIAVIARRMQLGANAQPRAVGKSESE